MVQEEVEKLFKDSALIMLAVARNEGESARVMADAVSSTYSYVTRELDELQNLGLIEKRRNARKYEIHLTEKGEAVVDGLYTITEGVTSDGI